MIPLVLFWLCLGFLIGFVLGIYISIQHFDNNIR